MKYLQAADHRIAPHHDDWQEAQRLKQLACYPISPSVGDPNLDSITQVAVAAVGGNIGGISLVFQSEIWLPARVGLDITSVPRAGSFCTCAIEANSDSLYEVEDARADARFQANPLVTDSLPFLHYAGAPLRGSGGYLLGTLWMMRHQPGRLTTQQSNLFVGIAKLVVETLELRHTNEVTGMPNRFVILRRLQAQLEAPRAPQTLVGYLDLIAFRQFNDALGWDGANALLMLFAQRLAAWASTTNLVAHLDGDKFAFALFGTGPEIDETVESLRAMLVQKFIAPDKKEQTLQARIGFVFAAKVEDMSAEALLDAAETASSTINSTVQSTSMREYAENMRLRARGLSEFKAMLDGEPGLGRLVAYYQPQVNFAEGRLIGMEALARWQHPTKGVVMPGHFIALAEGAGRIYQVDNIILDQVCCDLRQWLDAGFDSVPVSFNYSRTSLLNPNVIEDFKGVLEKYSIPGHMLELEITETQLLEDLQSVSLRVKKFRELGVHIAVDDFGTGYSNLDAIHNFPFDRLKVDRQFVNGVSNDERIAGLFELVRGIAKLFNAELLCEGVEHLEDLMWLKSRGACCVQGWYFSPARPKLEMDRILGEVQQQRTGSMAFDADEFRHVFRP